MHYEVHSPTENLPHDDVVKAVGDIVPNSYKVRNLRYVCDTSSLRIRGLKTLAILCASAHRGFAFMHGLRAARRLIREYRAGRHYPFP